MSYPELLLSNQLCFLVHRLERAINARYKPLLKRFGLTYTQYLAMLALWERGELTVGELCDALHMDSGTISPMIKRMEAAGLIKKERDRDDERSVRVSLLPAGKALEEHARSVPGALASCVVEDEADYWALRRLFTQLLDKLEGQACGQGASSELADSELSG
jgi:DNA-binding MarR family transcriptional regulator